MSRTPEPKSQPAVLPDARGVSCAASTGRQRCRKMIADQKGELMCPNGHFASLVTVLECFASNPNSFSSFVLSQLEHVPDKAYAALYERIVSGEMSQGLDPTVESNHFKEHFPGSHPRLFSQMLSAFDLHNPWMAQRLRGDLRAYLLKNNLLLGRYLNSLSGAKGTVFLERCLLVWHRSHFSDPRHYQTMSPLYLEAARHLDDAFTPLYESNLSESEKALDERYIPVYFSSPIAGIQAQPLRFEIIMDPLRLSLPNPASIFFTIWGHLQPGMVQRWGGVGYYRLGDTNFSDFHSCLKGIIHEEAGRHIGDEWSDHPYRLLDMATNHHDRFEPILPPGTTSIGYALVLAQAFRDIVRNHRHELPPQ